MVTITTITAPSNCSVDIITPSLCTCVSFESVECAIEDWCPFVPEIPHRKLTRVVSLSDMQSLLLQSTMQANRYWGSCDLVLYTGNRWSNTNVRWSKMVKNNSGFFSCIFLTSHKNLPDNLESSYWVTIFFSDLAQKVPTNKWTDILLNFHGFLAVLGSMVSFYSHYNLHKKSLPFNVKWFPMTMLL